MGKPSRTTYTVIADRLSKKTGISQQDMRAIVKALYEELFDAVCDGEEVALGFGKFCHSVRKTTRSFNYTTKQWVTATDVPILRFKPTFDSKLEYRRRIRALREKKNASESQS
jgi:nucleoid DNA-binding protein